MALVYPTCLLRDKMAVAQQTDRKRMTQSRQATFVWGEAYCLGDMLSGGCLISMEKRNLGNRHWIIWVTFPIGFILGLDLPSSNQPWRAGKSTIYCGDFPIKTATFDYQRAPH